MCTPTPGTMIPYGLKIPSPYFSFGPSGGVTQGQLAALDFQRNQLHDYNVRVQLGLRNYQHSLGLSPFHTYITDPYTHAYFYKHDPRARFVQEEPKPSHSYIGLIGMAILQSKDKKLVLSDIYQWILDNYAYFRTRGPGWRNSIRHNLSLNDCFIKSGRSANGKGHYWAVHPANVDDFERGDFRRRRAQRKVRRHMGLAVPDDDDSPSPSPTQPWMHHDVLGTNSGEKHTPDPKETGDIDVSSIHSQEAMKMLLPQHPTPAFGLAGLSLRVKKPSRKRLFDMASLLAPDEEDGDEPSPDKIHCNPQTESASCDDNHIAHLSENEGPNKEKINSEIMLCRTRDNEDNLYDEDNFCDDDDDDDDNSEEIHVTSDVESPEQLNHAKCFSDVNSNLSVHSDIKTDDENDSFSYKHVENKSSMISPSNHSSNESDEDTKNSTRQEEQQQQQQQEQRVAALQQSQDKLHSLSSVSECNNMNIIYSHNIPGSALKQPHSIYTTTPSKAFYDFMADKLRNQESKLFHHLGTKAHLTIPQPGHLISGTDNLGHTKQTEASLSVSDERSSIQRNMIFQDNNISKSDDSTVSQDVNHLVSRSSLDATASLSLSGNISLRPEHRSLQTVAKDFSREKFSAFETLGIRTHPSIYTGHLHPGMVRAMAPFSSPAMLTQSHVMRPGIPTSCLQHLQASPAVSVPSLPPMSAQTQSDIENKR